MAQPKAFAQSLLLSYMQGHISQYDYPFTFLPFPQHECRWFRYQQSNSLKQGWEIQKFGHDNALLLN